MEPEKYLVGREREEHILQEESSLPNLAKCSLRKQPLKQEWGENTLAAIVLFKGKSYWWRYWLARKGLQQKVISTATFKSHGKVRNLTYPQWEHYWFLKRVIWKDCLGNWGWEILPRLLFLNYIKPHVGTLFFGFKRTIIQFSSIFF